MSDALVWFRRDLRSFDHAALYHALTRFDRVFCAFLFDRDILEALPTRLDRRVEFIWKSVAELDHALDVLACEAGGEGSGLIVGHGHSEAWIPQLALALGVDAVYVNRDYEPAALARDQRVAARLAAHHIDFVDFKDQVIFDRDEVLTRTGTPFSVFTPYRNAWLRHFDPAFVRSYPVSRHARGLAPRRDETAMPSLAAIGFAPTDLDALPLPAGMSGGHTMLDDFAQRLDRYKRARDYPGAKGVSYLSAHLRFGTVSIRELAALAWSDPGEGAQSWLNELIWRDFYHMILCHHPRVEHENFRPEFDCVVWDDAPELVAAWCEGKTGFPFVDAGMRQLNATGFMHNRLRMVTASFLTKDLGVDWRVGERYFAAQLNDYDLAANNGGWQWAASTGCDAQPWFRIFNPVVQSERFDPRGAFIRRYVPELAQVPDKFIHAPWKMNASMQKAAGVRIGRDYPMPVVDHAAARVRTLQRFAVVKTRRATA